MRIHSATLAALSSMLVSMSAAAWANPPIPPSDAIEQTMETLSENDEPAESDILAAAEAMTVAFKRKGMLGHDAAEEIVRDISPALIDPSGQLPHIHKSVLDKFEELCPQASWKLNRPGMPRPHWRRR